VRDAARVRTAIDHFVEAALEKQGLSLGLEADRATLLRRVSFDLTGLPPSLSEMAAFLEDTSPDAYERVVQRYLSSPHYGERWGKYWLDGAGYADSNGYFSADSDRPLAYRYRDYVIRAFNEDKPYDRFVQEQLAGDELAGYGPDSDVTGQTIELLTATHFQRNAPDGTGESDGNADEVRTDKYSVLEGNLQIAMNCLLGITIQCARVARHRGATAPSGSAATTISTRSASGWPAAASSRVSPSARPTTLVTTPSKTVWGCTTSRRPSSTCWA